MLAGGGVATEVGDLVCAGHGLGTGEPVGDVGEVLEGCGIDTAVVEGVAPGGDELIERDIRRLLGDGADGLKLGRTGQLGSNGIVDDDKLLAGGGVATEVGDLVSTCDGLGSGEAIGDVGDVLEGSSVNTAIIEGIPSGRDKCRERGIGRDIGYIT